MSFSSPNTLLLFLLHILPLSFFWIKAQCQLDPSQRPFNNTVSAIFVFGDSTVDPGNNNFIKTTTRSNFPPYGRDFFNHIPTGRFTNGRLVTDFIASYVGVKDFVPPYLDPTLTVDELMTGVSFASAGSGFDPLTATISSAIPIEKQVEYFREYKSRIEMFIGKDRTDELINQAVFMVSAGSNDYVVNYYGIGEPVTQKLYPNVRSYHDYLIQNINQFMKELMEEGARKIAMVGLPPMGCLPEVITLSMSTAIHGRKCVDSLSSVAQDYNTILDTNLKLIMQASNPPKKILYADIYQPLTDMIQKQTIFGFEYVNTGCCGMGYIEASILCNTNLPVCSDASKYVFWDAIHPTETAYYIIFTALRPIVNEVIQD